jgi:hypothetical protein
MKRHPLVDRSGPLRNEQPNDQDRRALAESERAGSAGRPDSRTAHIPQNERSSAAGTHAGSFALLVRQPRQ